MPAEVPIQWIKNQYSRRTGESQAVGEILSPDLPRKIRQFHRQVPGYQMSPLKGLPNLAARLGVKHPGRLAVGHTWNRTGDRRGGAARPTVFAAIHAAILSLLS